MKARINWQAHAEELKAWETRVQELEAEGLTRSDAQAVADLEASKGLIEQA